MARHPIPQVINDQLTSLDAAGSPLLAIQVGSADWHDWLNNPATRSFAYHCANGILTACREQRHGTWYWYAYRTQHGRLHKAYLGKSEELTPGRLKDVAAMMNLGALAVHSSLIQRGLCLLQLPPSPPPAQVDRLLTCTRAQRESRSVPFSSLQEHDSVLAEPAIDPDRFFPSDHQWAGHWISFPSN